MENEEEIRGAGEPQLLEKRVYVCAILNARKKKATG